MTGIRATLAVAVMLLAGCASRPYHGWHEWRGLEPNVVKVQLRYFALELPAEGWLVEVPREQAQGFVAFTKWGSGSYRYSRDAYFVIEPKWRQNSHYLGLLALDAGAPQFCTMNPEHGAFVEGDRITHTYAWDYCAKLIGR